jgi:hypothetical protein
MIPISSTEFDVRYGRIGTKGQSQRYPMSQWIKKLTEKLTKGYSFATLPTSPSPLTPTKPPIGSPKHILVRDPASDTVDCVFIVENYDDDLAGILEEAISEFPKNNRGLGYEAFLRTALGDCGYDVRVPEWVLVSP